MGIWCGAPFGVSFYIWKSLIPTLLGNLVGGGMFVATAYWYLYLTGDAGISVDFNTGSLATAMEAGGPMRRTRTETAKDERRMTDDTIIGRDPGEQQLPRSGGQMMSALGKELSDGGPYTKSHAERTKESRETSPDEKV